jgi:hypothetical protein
VNAVLRRLAEAVREEGGLLAGALAADRGGAAALGALAAAGPRSAPHPEEVAFVVEAAHEAYLLHYGVPRLFDSGDRDLDLLAGDRLYALGLERLAAIGDLEAIGELADIIALCAQAHAQDDPDLAGAVWEAGAVAIGWGADDALRGAKDAARDGDADAAEALRAAARERARDLAPPR